MVSVVAARAVLLACLVGTGAGLAALPSTTRAQSSSARTKIEPMPDEAFWALIGSTIIHAGDPKRQAAALHSALAALPLDQVEAFAAAFSTAMARSYSWDLWGAVHVVHGRAGNDGFEHVRFWLISKG